jgi:hypothetical protein
MTLLRHAARRSALLVMAVAVTAIAGGPAVAQPGQAPRAEAASAYAELPLSFVPNAGQADQRILYSAQGPGYGFAFTRNRALFALVRGDARTALGLRFVNGDPHVELAGRGLSSGTVNYLLGNDPARWRTGLPAYESVVYRDLWPGIDLLFRGAEGKLKYEFLVRPRAVVDNIQLAYEGTNGLSVDREGNLQLRTALGVLTDSHPVSYQEIDGRRVSVKSHFVLGGDGRFSFALGSYDEARSLVIDPGLLYSTLLGGSNVDQGRGITVDAAGNAIVTGLTASANFPPFGPAADTSLGGPQDAFVTKLNPMGSGLIYSTYLGGSMSDAGFATTVDAAGNAFVTGTTASPNFPVVGVASAYTGSGDAFVSKFDSTGLLVSSRYLGGTGSDQGFGITVDASGSPSLTGVTASANFPVGPVGDDITWNGLNDAFVTKLTPNLAMLLYSTFLGGMGQDTGQGIALDAAGQAIVTGVTESANFPVGPVANDPLYNGLQDVFVTKFNLTGSTRLFSTYLGSTGSDQGFGIAVDSLGSAVVTGYTGSSTFPTFAAYDPSYNGGSFDAFVTKYDPTGAALLFSTFLGGTSTDQAFGIALDASARPTVTGTTFSATFPTTPGAFDTSNTGGFGDAFVTRFASTGSALVYSTFLGGSGVENGFAIFVDPSTSAYVTGGTTPFGATPFPTTAGAFDTSPNGSTDAFVTKLDLIGAPMTLVLTPPTAENEVGNPHTVTATVTDFGGQPVPGVTVRFTVTGANPTSGSDVTDANGQATFTYTGTVAGLDTIDAYADTNNNGVRDLTTVPPEPAGVATKLWTPGPPAFLTLMPLTDTNTVGEEHCVTATVTDVFGNPVPDVIVRFTVLTATITHATPASGSATTDANGQAEFCYTAALPGVDDIYAFADTNGDGDQDAFPPPPEPSNTATKVWVLPPSTEFCEVTITNGGWIIAANGDRANFGGNARVLEDGTVRGQEEYQDHGPAEPMNVHSIELTAMTCSEDLTEGTIFGRATIDGSGDYMFRIDVTDNGHDDTYGIILSNGYASGQQPLGGGNVTIHRS